MSSETATSVYVKDKAHGWLPATVISYEGDAAKVSVAVPTEGGETKEDRDVKLSHYDSNNLPLQNVDEGGKLIEMADMVDLPSLHEAAILYNLKARHGDKNPYTRVGDIIIACNPFQWIDGLYSDDTRELYIDQLIWNAPKGGDAKSGLPPHVYETSSLAYRGLAVDDQHQSILVSGESGAGKTETVKIVMSQLASVQPTEFSSPGNSGVDKSHMSHDPRANIVVKRVLDSNPLLEAFGNAKTVRNDNSSRFGKYIQLQFDVEDATAAAFSGKAVPSCVLAGSLCETYLLEKSRVVSHEPIERTYHIFYQLIAAPDDTKAELWDGLAGKTNSCFRYVGETDTTAIEGRSDGERWKKTVDALSVVGVTGENLRTLMRAVCTVLQLGNLVFAEDPADDEKCVITSTDEMEKLADLMGVANDDIKKALTTRTVIAGKEQYTVPLKVSDARDSCDAFAKEIYQQAFDWLVSNINEATRAEANYADASEVDEFGTIGLLDIFGFESFQVNRFEQLCINYCNEKLQQKYTLDIFKSVQDEYEYEGIELGEVTFSDNAEVLNLVEGRMGIIAVLNEECVRPKGNDSSFVSKVKTVNKDISCLIHERLHRPNEFGISHYAGPVKYDATMFVQKNTDSLPNDLLECACKSTNDLISTELKAAADAKAAKPTSARGRKSALTVATKFRSQLTSLMENISKTRTRYIRCIKPNPEKQPIRMNLLSSAEQLRCAGVVAAVTISRVAYPNRLMQETVLERFRCLSSMDVRHDMDEKKDDTEPGGSGLRDAIEELLSELLKGLEVTTDTGDVKKAYACGKTRVYFRAGALEHLESERLLALGVLATAVERIVRGFTARSIFLRVKSTTIDTQSFARRTLARNSFLRARQASISLSCWVRCIFASMELLRLRRERASIRLQSRFRMQHAMSVLANCKSAAIAIQKIGRGSCQRPKYRILLAEAREEAKVNTKLAALQKRLAEAEMKWLQADKQRIEAEKRAAGVAAAPAEEAVLPAATTATAQGENTAEQQHALIDESGEMLEYLRKQVFNLRSKNYLLRTDISQLKEENQQLLEHSAATAASFEALKQHAHQLSLNNMKLTVSTASQKEGVAELRRKLKTADFKHTSEVLKLKKEMKAKEEAHQAEVAKLKKELEGSKQMKSSSVVAPERRKSSKSSTLQRARFKGGANFQIQRSMFIDTEEEWGHDGYLSRQSAQSKHANAATRRYKKGKQKPYPRSQPQPQLSPPTGTQSSLQSSLQTSRAQSPVNVEQSAKSSLAAAVSTSSLTGSKVPTAHTSSLASAASKSSSLAKAAETSSLAKAKSKK